MGQSLPFRALMIWLGYWNADMPAGGRIISLIRRRTNLFVLICKPAGGFVAFMCSSFLLVNQLLNNEKWKTRLTEGIWSARLADENCLSRAGELKAPLWGKVKNAFLKRTLIPRPPEADTPFCQRGTILHSHSSSPIRQPGDQVPNPKSQIPNPKFQVSSPIQRPPLG